VTRFTVQITAHLVYFNPFYKLLTHLSWSTYSLNGLTRWVSVDQVKFNPWTHHSQICLLDQSSHSWINQVPWKWCRLFCWLQSENCFPFRKSLQFSTIHHRQYYNITRNVWQLLYLPVVCTIFLHCASRWPRMKAVNDKVNLINHSLIMNEYLTRLKLPLYLLTFHPYYTVLFSFQKLWWRH